LEGVTVSNLKSYLAKLEACLGGLPPDARQAVVEELRGHLEDRAAALRAGGLEKEASMSEAIERFGEAREVGTALRDVHGRSSWAETLAAIVPLLILGPVTAVWHWGYNMGYLPAVIVGWPRHLAILAALIGFGMGWARGFPRWSYPHTGLVAIFLLNLLSKSVPLKYSGPIPAIVDLLNLPFAVLLVAATFLLIVRIRHRFRPLSQSIRHDWTRLSFGLYILVILAFWMASELVPVGYRTPYMLGGSLIFTAGALLYMRSTNKSQRILALLICGTLAVTVAVSGRVSYYQGQLLPGLWRPGRWTGEAQMAAIVWGWLAALMVAPALLSLRRRPGKSVRAG
jgi:hypothetical protein